VPTLTNAQGWFTLQVPREWDSLTEDCVTTLKTPLGIVYLSAARHAGGPRAGFGGADFLARFLRFLGIGIEEESIALTQGPGHRVYSYARESEGTHWRYWSVTDDETALLISYTCAASDAGREAAEIDAIVDSIRLYHSGPMN
jgi:hypothetical protein